MVRFLVETQHHASLETMHTS